MKNSVLILILCLISPSHIAANSDTIRIVQSDSSRFEGISLGYSVDSLLVYKGTIKHLDFSKDVGYFEFKDDSLNLLYARKVNGANDTFFINSFLKIKTQCELYHDDKYGMYEIPNTSSGLKFHDYKTYDNNKKRWIFFTGSVDGEYQWGHSYDVGDDILYNLKDNRTEDAIMWGVVFFLIVALALWIIFRPLFRVEKWKMPLIMFIFISLTSLFSTLFVEDYIKVQIVFPLLSIMLIPLLEKYIKFERRIIPIFIHFILCILFIGFWGYLQFYQVKDTAKFADGAKVEILWRRGTNLSNRFLIKRMIADMVPVPVSDHDKQYTVYVSKYEFREGGLPVVNHEFMSWMSYWLHDEPINDLSFREAQFALQMLKQICGVQFDLLTYREWQSAALNQPHSPNKCEFVDVDDGMPNTYGLIHIASNAPEYTSNYCITNRLGIDADTLKPSYNNVVIAGFPYQCEDSLNFGYINKNLRDGSVGFRLIYRPNDIGARQFHIKGTLRSDVNVVGLPKTISLLSMDGIRIDELENYECFEELFIECRFRKKTIEVIDLSTKQHIKIEEPKGLGYYDFEPIFNFVGM